MIARRSLIVWMFLVFLWTTPLYALGIETPSDHSEQLWRLAASEQEALEQNGVMLNDPTMDRCLAAVTLRLWEQVASVLKVPVVEVMKEIRTDAYAYPNGYIVLTTGMLEQIENEDQLAIILAHEIIHYARQHTIQLYDRLWSSGRLTSLRPADSGATMPAADVEQQVNAAEYQADSEGLAIFKAAGYCEGQIPRLFSTIIDRMRAQGQSGALEYMVARDMRMQTMIGPRAMVDTCPSSADNRQAFFLGCVAPALMANAQIAIQRGDWGVADRCLTTYVTINPGDARAYYLQGEMTRQRDDIGDENQSMAYYEAALKIDPQFPLVHRALGEMYFKAGQYRQAKPYFETFINLAPEDESRAFIEGYLLQCQN